MRQLPAYSLSFWVDPDEGAIEEFEYLMAGKQA